MELSINQKSEKNIHAENKNQRQKADLPPPFSSISTFSNDSGF